MWNYCGAFFGSGGLALNWSQSVTVLAYVFEKFLSFFETDCILWQQIWLLFGNLWQKLWGSFVEALGRLWASFGETLGVWAFGGSGVNLGSFWRNFAEDLR